MYLPLFRLTLILVAMVAVDAFGHDKENRGLRHPVYLVSHGWHAGIVVKRKDVTDDVLLLPPVFDDVEYLEIGWGDLDFYRTPEPHPGLVMKAALLPTESVLHVVGFDGAVTAYFPTSEIIEFELSRFHLEGLVASIASAFTVEDTKGVMPIGAGLYGKSRFFKSKESYHLFNTCNVWTARRLRDAGISVVPSQAISVGDLMHQAREYGTVINHAPDVPPKDVLDLIEW